MMKFYSLAVCGILCVLSSISCAKKERYELDLETKSPVCPPGKRPMKLTQLDSDNAGKTREKRRTKVRCVKNDQEISEQKGKEKTTPAPNKVEALDREVPNIKCPFGSTTVTVWTSCLRGTKDSRDCKYTAVRCLSFRGFWMDTNPEVSKPTVKGADDEIIPNECPFAHRPVNVSPFCPTDAKVTAGCPPSKMMACVPEPFGNNPGSLRLLGPEWEIGRSPKTEAELNFQMAHKACIFGQRPVKISPWCRTGANDIIDCGHAEVWCLEESFTPALKKVEELEKETLSMICPRKHDPVLIRSLCPASSKRTTNCDAFRKACRPEPDELFRMGSRNSFARFDRWNGMEGPEDWDEPDQSGYGGRHWRSVNNNNNGFLIRP